MEPTWYVSTVMDWYTIPERFLPFAAPPKVDWDRFYGTRDIDVIVEIVEQA